jgi:hypothetical protein
MRTTQKQILEVSLIAGLLAVGLLVVAFAGCGSSSSSDDVAYEDTYSSDYYYPADVAYSGPYAAGWGYGGYGFYAATPVVVAGINMPIPTVVDGGILGVGGRSGAGGAGGAPGGTTVRGAVGQAIRNLALGGSVCSGHATVTHPGGAASACSLTGNGVNIVFSGCQLSGGGTVDGTVNVAVQLSASDTTCGSSTKITLGYTLTATNLSYTGTNGVKVVIPSETDMGTTQFNHGQTPTTLTVMTNGEIQRMDSGGTITSDRTFTGTRTYSSISLANQSYTVDGMTNVTEKTGGGAGTISGMGIMRDNACCRPTGGTLSITRTGGAHPGTHSLAFSAACGVATLDGKMVMFPACP